MDSQVSTMNMFGKLQGTENRISDLCYTDSGVIVEYMYVSNTSFSKSFHILAGYLEIHLPMLMSGYV